MIERKFVAQRMKEHQIQEYITKSINKVGHSNTKLQRTPLGEKIIITASRPGLVVGKGGSNISRLTSQLKEKFALENPQIELNEVDSPFLDANIVAESIANSIERFGTKQFKGVGHRAMANVMGAGALGVEILVSGKVPSKRAKTWRFYSGYLKNCGDIAITGVQKAYSVAKLKTGIIGIQVKIMPPTTILPDKVVFIDTPEVIVETLPVAPDHKKEEAPEKKKRVRKKKEADE